MRLHAMLVAAVVVQLVAMLSHNNNANPGLGCIGWVDATEATPLITMRINLSDPPGSSVTGTGSFRIGVAGAVGVATSRIELKAWSAPTGFIDVEFIFKASSASSEPTSTALATTLQTLLFEKSSVEYDVELKPMRIDVATFDGLPDPTTADPTTVAANTTTADPAANTTTTEAGATTTTTEAEATTEASEGSTAAVNTTTAEATTTEAVEEPTPEPTEACNDCTPIPTPLGPRSTINGTGMFGAGLTEEEEDTSTIWIVVFVCIGVLCLAGVAVCLIKCCTSKKEEKKRVYGDRIP